MYRKLLLNVLFAVGVIGAAELHVSKTGNDGNSGSADAPLATLAKAVELVKPGDVVKIGPGIYREQLTIKRSGTKDAPIVFEGTRGKDGEYLTIIESPGVTISNWEQAPEIAPNVWKTKLEKRPDLMMMDGDMITYINRFTMDIAPRGELPSEISEEMLWDKFGPKCKRIPGLDLLKLKSDIWVTHRYFGKRKEQFWPTIGNVLTGWKDGYLYLRFANDYKPEEHGITASYGVGFVLQNTSFLTFRDLHVRGSRKQFHLLGKSSDNIIEKCLLMHGGARIHITRDVKNTIVRDNVLTAGFIERDLFGHRSPEEMRSCLLYLVFKYIIGTSLSDDVGVNDTGIGTRIYNNIIMQGLIGIDAWGVNCEIYGNVVRKMSSVGICTGETCVGQSHHNLVMDCGIPLRIHHLRQKRAKREEYHYGNLFVQVRNGGQQVFVHCSSHSVGDDVINFDKNGVYLENPPNPVDAGKIYIYHNTFWGGLEGTTPPMFDVTQYSRRFRMSMPFFVVNNIYKDSIRLSSKSHDLVGPNLLYVYDKDIQLEKRRDKDVPKFNKVLDLKESQLIWNRNDILGLPDLTLAPNSPAIEAGVDVSKPFTVFGKEYPAFPGFKPGYYKGNAPAAGALQLGESQNAFIAMHQRAEAARKMLAELQKKAAAEARSKAAGK